MTPYYDEGGITIYHGDCRDYLRGAPIVDMVLTDPPYGIGWESNARAVSFGKIVGDDGSLDILGVLRELVRVLAGNRHIYVFGRFDMSSLPLGGVSELVWDKVSNGAGNTDLVWAPSHEPIMFGVKANLAQRKRGKGNGPARLRRGSVLRYQRPTGSAVNRHPTEKPVGLLRELIESSSKHGELVLDAFCGVGSTLVAAHMEGRRAIGIEIEERYCEIAANRLRQSQSYALPLEAVS